MKLLYTNFHDGDGGGHTTYISTLAAGLADRHAVHVAAPATSRLHLQAAAVAGVHAWAQSFPTGLNRLAARRRGQRRRPRIVLTKHNSKPMTGIGHWWRARQGTDQVIAVCEYTRLQLMISPYRRCRVATVHNGVDIGHFSPWPDALAEQERRRWVGDRSALLLGSNAGTADYKGWMDLVEALALLPAGQRALVHLLVAGKHPAEHARQHIEELGLAGQVHFAGLLADVRPAVAAVDAGFVLSWGVETISFACREMMAMGKPVLVSEYAGLPENIRPGHDGWSVPPRDHAAMAGMLQRLLRQRLELPAMGRAAREHAEASFGVGHFVERTEAVYTALLAGEIMAQSDGS